MATRTVSPYVSVVNYTRNRLELLNRFMDRNFTKLYDFLSGYPSIQDMSYSFSNFRKILNRNVVTVYELEGLSTIYNDLGRINAEYTGLSSEALCGIDTRKHIIYLRNVYAKKYAEIRSCFYSEANNKQYMKAIIYAYDLYMVAYIYKSYVRLLKSKRDTVSLIDVNNLMQDYYSVITTKINSLDVYKVMNNARKNYKYFMNTFSAKCIISLNSHIDTIMSLSLQMLTCNQIQSIFCRKVFKNELDNIIIGIRREIENIIVSYEKDRAHTDILMFPKKIYNSFCCYYKALSALKELQSIMKIVEDIEK